MAAPRSRRLRNQTAPVTHTRREMALAIGGSVAIVAVTVVLVWAMRPGNAFNPGSGGLIHRQTKASLWLLATLVVIAIAAWMVLRPESRIRHQSRVLVLAIGGVVVVAAAVMAVWHHSLVHDYSSPTPATTPVTTAAPLSSSVPRTTATTAPATTAPAASTTTPTTAATTTTGG